MACEDTACCLRWIQGESEKMLASVESWAAINSGSHHLQGLGRMADALEEAFRPLECTSERLELENGPLLRFSKRREAPLRLFLCGHLDTVFSEGSSFQSCTRRGENLLKGPGVADMKGGLAVMITALKAFEKSRFAEKLGWTACINSDEETGSRVSAPHLLSSAKGSSAALLFEPAFPDGALVGSRKGSANFELSCSGRAAHAGRNFYEGAHAIYALAELLAEAGSWNDPKSEAVINAGLIGGGSSLNSVPKEAFCLLNLRASDLQELEELERKLRALLTRKEGRGISFELKKLSFRPPKPLDPATEELLFQLKLCAEELQMPLQWRPSGGVCDGNDLAAAGLPTIDTLGAVGGGLHTEEEYLFIDSLEKRASLAFLFLCHLAKGTPPL